MKANKMTGLLRMTLLLSLGAGAAVPVGGTGKDAAALKNFRALTAQNIREQLAHRMELPENDFQVELDNLNVEPAIAWPTVRSVQVLGLGSLGARRLEGLFTLPVIAQTSDGQERQLQVSGVLKVTGPVYVAKNPLPRTHVIQKSDLLVTRLPWRTLVVGTFGVSERELVGQRVRAFVSAGGPINISELDEPLAVKSGEMVDVTVVAGPGVLVRSRGVAKQEGKVGDMIRVEQPDTKKMLLGLVTGDKTVEIRL